MKVIRTNDGSLVSMPARKLRDGGFQDTVAPINREARKMIEGLVLKEFERVTGELVRRRIPKD